MLRRSFFGVILYQNRCNPDAGNFGIFVFAQSTHCHGTEAFAIDNHRHPATPADKPRIAIITNVKPLIGTADFFADFTGRFACPRRRGAGDTYPDPVKLELNENLAILKMRSCVTPYYQLCYLGNFAVPHKKSGRRSGRFFNTPKI
jgi:hypothetical protein